MLTLETLNRKAFDYYNLAIRKVDGYNKTLDPNLLDAAVADLDTSIQADRNFFRAANYKGIVFDLMGKSTEAIQQFDAIVPDTPDTFKGEVWYNTAVSNYHLYSEPHVNAAVALLDSVIAQYPGNIRLRLLAGASRAQCKGMLVFHASRAGDLKRVTDLKGDADSKADTVLAEASKIEVKKALGADLINEISWIAHNAKGIAAMFQDDHLRDQMMPGKSDEYLAHLDEALQQFTEGQKNAPSHWALACNIASTELRIGYWYIRNNKPAEADGHFKTAIEGLDDVIARLKPEYDFANYEKGRAYRMWGKFDEAKKFLNIAKSVTGYNKSVQNSTIQKQIDMADAKNSDWTYTATGNLVVNP